jgi:hypothetical protein
MKKRVMVDPHHMTLQRTGIPLRSIAAGELGR